MTDLRKIEILVELKRQVFLRKDREDMKFNLCHIMDRLSNNVPPQHQEIEPLIDIGGRDVPIFAKWLISMARLKLRSYQPFNYCWAPRDSDSRLNFLTDLISDVIRGLDDENEKIIACMYLLLYRTRVGGNERGSGLCATLYKVQCRDGVSSEMLDKMFAHITSVRPLITTHGLHWWKPWKSEPREAFLERNIRFLKGECGPMERLYFWVLKMLRRNA
jgi:hypothetical protein